MRKQKTEEEKAAAMQRMLESIAQLQAKEGPYYEKWLAGCKASQEAQVRKE